MKQLVDYRFKNQMATVGDKSRDVFLYSSPFREASKMLSSSMAG